MALLKRSLLPAALLLTLFMALPFPGAAQVSVGVHIGPPPPYRIAGPPAVIVIPGTYVYMVPDIGEDLLFYGGIWYRPYQGRWFNARSYNGPWGYVHDPRVPRALLELPPDYRQVPPGWRRIPYGDLRRNWAGWQRDRYWDRDPRWREGWHGRPEERRGEGPGHFEGRPEERREGSTGRGRQGDGTWRIWRPWARKGVAKAERQGKNKRACGSPAGPSMHMRACMRYATALSFAWRFLTNSFSTSVALLLMTLSPNMASLPTMLTSIL